MNFGRFFGKLLIGNVLLLSLVVAAGLIFIAREFDGVIRRQTQANLKAQGRMIARLLEAELNNLPDSAPKVRERVAQLLVDKPETRVTIIAADGTVLADTHHDPTLMENHADRPEVVEALTTGEGQAIRYSDTLRRDLSYYALRLGSASETHAVVRVAIERTTIGTGSVEARRLVWTIGTLISLAILTVVLGLAWLWAKPLGRIMLAAQKIAEGDFTARAIVSGGGEMAALAGSVNRMRESLLQQIRTIDHQRHALDSLIAQLQEGVVLIDEQGHIMLANPLARELLQLPRASDSKYGRAISLEQSPSFRALQRIIWEMTPPTADNSDSKYAPTAAPTRGAPTRSWIGAKLVSRAESSVVHSAEDGLTREVDHETRPSEQVVREGRIQVDRPDGPIVLLARATRIVLADPDHPASPGPQTRYGQLVVLTDITELERVIQIKTDFASNASHELRTPLSAIRAALETTLQMDLQKDADEAKRFLAMIDRHSARLQDTVTDLLELSRLESSDASFPVSPVNVPQLANELWEQLSGISTVKALRWAVDCPTDCEVITASGHLLRVILQNLLENAAKFTAQGGVRVTLRRIPGFVRISVEDTGCGIPPEDQDRVFERFYQVERARSAKSQGAIRGTGLGLSIVRHAVAAMMGRISLSSAIGVGTTVTFEIPQPPL